MAQCRIDQLAPDMSFEGYLLVRSSEVRQDKKGNHYVDMNLTDSSGEINCKNWNASGKGFEPGTIVFTKGTCFDFNGRLQLKIASIRGVTASDKIDYSLITPSAPRSGEDMMNEIQNTINGFQSNVLKQLTQTLVNRFADKLAYYPAAQRIHHAEKSGLLHHTTDMLRAAQALLTVYPYLNRDLLLSGVILHDLCKVEEMNSDSIGIVRDYSREGLLLGHLVLGVIRIQETADELGLADAEEVILLQHMLLSHHGEPEFGSPRSPMFAEAEVLHTIDTLDARLNDMQNATGKVSAGSFTEKLWSMDRRLYRPLFTKEKDSPYLKKENDSSRFL